MDNEHLDLDKVSEQVLSILKELGLSPIAFGLDIKLEKNEFERLADQHPYLVQPGIVLKTDTKSDGVQWYVQILKEVSSEDITST
jgi:hypothetical protein